MSSYRDIYFSDCGRGAPTGPQQLPTPPPSAVHGTHAAAASSSFTTLASGQVAVRGGHCEEGIRAAPDGSPSGPSSSPSDSPEPLNSPTDTNTDETGEGDDWIYGFGCVSCNRGVIVQSPFELYCHSSTTKTDDTFLPVTCMHCLGTAPTSSEVLSYMPANIIPSHDHAPKALLSVEMLQDWTLYKQMKAEHGVELDVEQFAGPRPVIDLLGICSQLHILQSAQGPTGDAQPWQLQFCEVKMSSKIPFEGWEQSRWIWGAIGSFLGLDWPGFLAPMVPPM